MPYTPMAPDATTSTKGVVQLSSAIDSASDMHAATSVAIKTVNDVLENERTGGGGALLALKSETPASLKIDLLRRQKDRYTIDAYGGVFALANNLTITSEMNIHPNDIVHLQFGFFPMQKTFLAADMYVQAELGIWPANQATESNDIWFDYMDNPPIFGFLNYYVFDLQTVAHAVGRGAGATLAGWARTETHISNVLMTGTVFRFDYMEMWNDDDDPITVDVFQNHSIIRRS